MSYPFMIICLIMCDQQKSGNTKEVEMKDINVMEYGSVDDRLRKRRKGEKGNRRQKQREKNWEKETHTERDRHTDRQTDQNYGNIQLGWCQFLPTVLICLQYSLHFICKAGYSCHWELPPIQMQGIGLSLFNGQT